MTVIVANGPVACAMCSAFKALHLLSHLWKIYSDVECPRMRQRPRIPGGIFLIPAGGILS